MDEKFHVAKALNDYEKLEEIVLPYYVSGIDEWMKSTEITLRENFLSLIGTKDCETKLASNALQNWLNFRGLQILIEGFDRATGDRYECLKKLKKLKEEVNERKG